MEGCFKCQRSENEVRLFDVIAGNEIVKMCERCAILEDIPIIKKPTTSQLKEAEKNYSVYQRMKKLAGLEKKEEKHDESILSRIKKLDENPEFEMPEEKSLNLVHNFHWYVIRARRNKGLSQKQLAMLLGESEEAIKIIEKGELPGEPEILIKKLEQFFQIKLKERTEKEIEEEKEKFRESSFLRKRDLERREKERDENKHSEFKEPVSEIVIESENKEDIVSSVAYGRTVDIERKEKEKTPARILSFETDVLKNLTLSDLQKMKREREKTERIIEAGEEEPRTENFIQEDSSLYKRDLGEKNDEKRKKEIREKIVDEMKYEALGKKKEEKKSTFDRKDLLKKRDYVPSISELAAKKKERALLEEPSLKKKLREENE